MPVYITKLKHVLKLNRYIVCFDSDSANDANMTNMLQDILLQFSYALIRRFL